MKEDLERTRSSYESEKKRRDIAERIDEVRAQQLELEEEKAAKAAEHEIAERSGAHRNRRWWRRQSQIFKAETTSSRRRNQSVRNAELRQAIKRREEVDEVGKDLGRKLDLHRRDDPAAREGGGYCEEGARDGEGAAQATARIKG